MPLIDVVILLIIAGIIGSIGQSIAGFSRGGFLVSCAVGFIGAMIGAYLSKAFKFHDMFEITVAGKPFPIVWSIIGSTLFVAVIGFFTRQRA